MLHRHAILGASFCTFAALLWSARAAEVISFSFGGGMRAGDVAGVSGVRVANWNNVTSGSLPAGTIADATGTVVPSMTLTWTGTGWNGTAGGLNDARMFSRQADVGGTNNVSVTNIPYSKYDAYFYMHGDTDDLTRTGYFQVDSNAVYMRSLSPDPGAAGTGYVQSTATSQTSYSTTPQGNYAVFSGLTSSTLTATVAAGLSQNSTIRNKVAGFQIRGTKITVGGASMIGSVSLSTVRTDPLVGARVIEISQNAATFLHLAEIQGWQGATNWSLLSAGATATESDDPFGNPAANAIDNNLTTFNHTGSGVGKWLRIDLNASRTLDTLTVYNRQNSDQSRAADVQVRVYGDVARTQLLYDQQLLGLDIGPGYVQSLALRGSGAGGSLLSTLDTGVDYVLELDANAVTSDQLVVLRGTATSTQLQVGGDLIVNLLAGTPAPGQTYRLLSADSITGTFNSITLPGGWAWDTSNLYITGEISLLPEPSTLALLLALGGGSLLRRTRRQCA